MDYIWQNNLKMKEYHVDCEYNKNGEKPKSLMGKTFNYPDIIVHSERVMKQI